MYHFLWMFLFISFPKDTNLVTEETDISTDISPLSSAGLCRSISRSYSSPEPDDGCADLDGKQQQYCSSTTAPVADEFTNRHRTVVAQVFISPEPFIVKNAKSPIHLFHFWWVDCLARVSRLTVGDSKMLLLPLKNTVLFSKEKSICHSSLDLTG